MPTKHKSIESCMTLKFIKSNKQIIKHFCVSTTFKYLSTWIYCTISKLQAIFQPIKKPWVGLDDSMTTQQHVVLISERKTEHKMIIKSDVLQFCSETKYFTKQNNDESSSITEGPYYSTISSYFRTYYTKDVKNNSDKTKMSHVICHVFLNGPFL